MQLLPVFFKILFKVPFFRKRYFRFYNNYFKPKDLFRGQTSICSFDDGLKIKADMDEWIQQQIYFFGTWDKRGLKFLKNHLEKDDVFIDIGANIGAFSLVASKAVGTGGQVHAFEPVSHVFERFRYNIHLNELTNITANRNAVYETSDILEMFLSAKENSGMSSIFHHNSENGIIEKVQSLTIDEYVENMNIHRIDLIKVDIVGAELYALKGMRNSLNRFRPVVLMEVGADVVNNIKIQKSEILDFMKDLNYVVRRIFPCGNTGEVGESKSVYTNFAFFPI